MFWRICSACCRRLSFLFISARRRATPLAGPTDASADFYQQILKYVGLLATIAVVVIVTRMARKALREAEQSRKAARSQESRVSIRITSRRPYDEMTLADDGYDQQLIENCHPPAGSIRRLRENTIWLSSAAGRPDW